MKTYLHVNYWEGEGKLDTLFEIADMNRYDGVELRSIYHCKDMTQKEYQEKVIALKQKYPHLGIVFNRVVDLVSDDRDHAEKDLESCLDFMEWASRECGTEVLNFFTGSLIRSLTSTLEFERNGSAMAKECHYERSAEGLKVIGDKAVSQKMRVALEMHINYLHDLPVACHKLMDMTDHDAVGLNYDHGNIAINKNGSSIQEVFEVVGGKIYYVHLKNMLIGMDYSFFPTHLEAGHINTAEVLMRLKDQGYDGLIAVEYPCKGDGFIAAKKDKEYLDTLKKWMG